MNKNFMLLCVAVLMTFGSSFAQFSLTAINTPVSEDFQTFQANGCSPTPAAGQLDSKNFAVFGLFNTGNPAVPAPLEFNDTAFVGVLARGYRNAPVTSAGLYAYRDTVSGARMLWFQPTGQSFTPGQLWSRAKNNTGQVLTDIQVSYDFVYWNDGPRSQSVKFEYSVDTTAGFITLSNDSTLGAADNMLHTQNYSFTLTGLALLSGQELFVRWVTDDKSGAGARDEVGLDNLSFTALTPNLNAVISFPQISGSVAENGLSISVDVSQNLPATCTVDLIVTGGTATNGTDYTTSATSISFDGVSTLNTFDINMFDDLLFEGNETVVITLSNPSGSCSVSPLSGTYTLTIVDDDIPAEVSFSTAALSVNEGGGSVSFTVEQDIAKPCTTTVAIVGGNAVAPADYTYAGTAVVFDGVSTTSAPIAIPIIDDALIEGTENIILHLSAPTSGCIVGNPDSLVISIVDNDLPTYNIGPVTTVNAQGVVDSLGISCWLEGVVHGVNYRQGAGGLQFGLADNTGSIWTFSSNKTFGYTLAEKDVVKVRGTINNFNGLAQINMDTLIVVSLGTGTLMNTTTVTSFVEADEADLLKVEWVKMVNPAQWNPAGSGFNIRVTNTVDTFTVRIDNDVDLFQQTAPTCKYFDLTGLLNQFDPTAPHNSGYQLFPRYAADIVCRPDPSVSISASTTTVNEAAGTVTVLVTLTNPNPEPTTVTLSTSGTATNTTDYTLGSTTVTFPANSGGASPVTINITDDALVETSETIILTLTNPTNNATIGTASVTLTIQDNDTGAIGGDLPQSSVRMFPNPGKTELNILTDARLNNVKLYNVLGQLQISSSHTSLNTAGLQQGIYHVCVETDKGVWNGTWVKE